MQNNINRDINDPYNNAQQQPIGQDQFQGAAQNGYSAPQNIIQGNNGYFPQQNNYQGQMASGPGKMPVGGEYDDEDDGNDRGGEKKSRRSKNDNDGRDFKCKHCDKTYLSYPALYTHSKQKHARGPDGEPRAPPSSGRGRGRPRKIPHHRTDPKSDDYFKAPERQGGPTNPLLWFHELFDTLLKEKYGKIEEYVLYKELLQFTPSEDAEGGDGGEGGQKGLSGENPLGVGMKIPQPSNDRKKPHHDDSEENKEGSSDEDGSDERQNIPPPVIKRDPKWKRDYFNLTEQDRTEMLVDEIFALYLFRTSQRVNEDFYKIVLAYVIFFRECLNEIGWNKRLESENIDLNKEPQLAEAVNNQQFCLVNTAEHAPEICNEFVTVYVDQNKHLYEIQRPDQIDLTINLCHWLFESQFTCSKLSMIT